MWQESSPVVQEEDSEDTTMSSTDQQLREAERVHDVDRIAVITKRMGNKAEVKKWHPECPNCRANLDFNHTKTFIKDVNGIGRLYKCLCDVYSICSCEDCENNCGEGT